MAENDKQTKKKSEMKVLGRRGDTALSWDINNDKEVDAAREMFDKRVKEDHWSAFKETIKYEKGERIEKFDPKAERIILVPPIAGG